ncbi:MAG: hypothetical protein K0U74_06755 [Alphaproteobacteria bacterium]|nr:hypothetical protein [Alphaproteobacteria bacterium]
MKILKLSLALGLLGMLAMPANAGYQDRRYDIYDDNSTYVDDIKQRIHRQKKRILYGYREGRFGDYDRRELRSHLRRIKEELKYVCEDDRVTRRERRYLHRMLDRNSKRIANIKYNSEYRGRSYTNYTNRHPQGYQSYKDYDWGDYRADTRRRY